MKNEPDDVICLIDFSICNGQIGLSDQRTGDETYAYHQQTLFTKKDQKIDHLAKRCMFPKKRFELQVFFS